MKVPFSALALTLFLGLPGAATAAIIQNGSFENPSSTWTNTASNYMAVGTGSTAITGWAVSNALSRGVAWAQIPTGDGYFASEGSYFVDLSGFGTEAGPNAALQQTLQNLIAGETYSTSVAFWGDPARLSINGSQIAAAGAGSGGWTTLTGTFVANSSQALLSVWYTGASGVAFVDNVTVTGREAGESTAVPEPGSLALMVAGLAALGFGRRAAKRARSLHPT